MKYRYRAVEPFWTHFYRLDNAQKEATRKAWKIFKENPFDPRLRHTKFTNFRRFTGGPFMRRTSREICAPRFIWMGIGSFQWI
jgi:hypothetical protein